MIPATVAILGKSLPAYDEFAAIYNAFATLVIEKAGGILTPSPEAHVVVALCRLGRRLQRRRALDHGDGRCEQSLPGALHVRRVGVSPVADEDHPHHQHGRPGVRGHLDLDLDAAADGRVVLGLLGYDEQRYLRHSLVAQCRPALPTLSWATSAGATSYEYCVTTATPPACDPWQSPGGQTSTAVGSLTPGATYSWQVRAWNSTGTMDGTGGWWTFTVAGTPPPPAPTKQSPSAAATGLTDPRRSDCEGTGD